MMQTPDPPRAGVYPPSPVEGRPGYPTQRGQYPYGQPLRQPGQYPYGRPPRQPRRGRGLWIALGVIVAVLLLMAVLVAAGLLLRTRTVQRHLEMGEKYLAELDYDSAVFEFTSAIQIDNRCAPAYLGRGDAYLALADYESAEDDYTMAIQLDAGTVDGYVGRSRAHAAQGERAEAEQDLEIAISNGLDEAQADEIRQENEAPAMPLTVDQLSWVMEPTYDYQQVMPLRGSSFSDCEGPFSDGRQRVNGSFWEMSFPGYSNLPQYYQVQLADGNWRLYYMPDYVDSSSLAQRGRTSDDPPYMRYDATGILPQTYDYNWSFAEPWNLITSADRGGGLVRVYYDNATRQGILEGGQQDFCIQPVAEAGLHKPYPAGRTNTANTGIYTGGTMVYSYGEISNNQRNQYEETLQVNTQEYPKGYIGVDGQPITDFVYDYAEDFSEGVAACCRNGKWGYIDETGDEITEFVYDGIWPASMVSPHSENYEYIEWLGAYPCTSDTMVVYKDGQVGLLYRDGRVLIDFGQFENMAPAYNNELWAKQNGLWGLIDLADAKQKAGLPAELTVTAKTEVPDQVEQMEILLGETGDVMPDYPRIQAEEDAFRTERGYVSSAKEETEVRTGPGLHYPVKETLLSNSSFYEEGILQSVPGWTYIRWRTDDGAGYWKSGWIPDSAIAS